MNDAELLREYANSESEAAFRELVERHLPLVYWAAVRQVGDAALAEDITQVVFTVLARKAGRLSSGTILAGWLFRTTHHMATKALRSEQRRRRREREALQMQQTEPDDLWEQLAPWLDEALAKLSEVERAAVLLHYFEHKRLREVGLALGLSEDAAQKRVSRAVEKLRKLLLARRLAIPLAVIPGLLMTHGAQAAPAYLSASVLSFALGRAALSAAASALVEAACRESPWHKAVMALPKAAGLAIVAGLAVQLWRLWPVERPHDQTAYSFETRIVARPRLVLPPPSSEQAAGPQASNSSASLAKPTSPSSLAPPALAVAQISTATNSIRAPAPPAQTEPVDEWGPIFAAMAREPPVRPFVPAATPTLRPRPYVGSYPVTWNSYPVARRNQPVFYGRGAYWEDLPHPAPIRPNRPSHFHNGSSPWMPFQKPTSAGAQRNSQRPTRKTL